MARRYHCRPGKHYYYADLEFWGQGGMCHIFDHRELQLDGSPMPDDKRLTSVAPREFKRRARMLGRCINLEMYGGDRLAKANLCNNMDRCADEAIFQGDQTDRRVSEHHIRHRQLCGKRSNGVTIQKPGRQQSDVPTGMRRDGAAFLGGLVAPPVAAVTLPLAESGLGRVRGRQVERKVFAESQIGTGECD